jgi:hypothetical protein
VWHENLAQSTNGENDIDALRHLAG